MKKVVKSWRFSTAGPVTKFKTMRLFAGERLVRKGIYFIMLFLVAAGLALSCMMMMMKCIVARGSGKASCCDYTLRFY